VWLNIKCSLQELTASAESAEKEILKPLANLETPIVPLHPASTGGGIDEKKLKVKRKRFYF
jgi:hypothetical protein